MNGKGESDFRETLYACAFDSLCDVLGKAASEAIMYYVKQKGGNAEDLANVLEEMFGPGASILKHKILKSFYAKTGFEFEEREGYTFSDYLKGFEKH